MITTYLIEDSWVVSENQCRVPGIYDSDETARAAVKFTDAQLKTISYIWNVKGLNRPATMRDLGLLGNNAK